ncbi:ribonuclease HII [Sulfurifustis variabilis]|uniref:Ribonuclease HII n=1 Tax=Sulfurifustis variabilis TaxID=1675686 RepID=A0A1B4V3K1_9GAMM|nr:ribonuclease HII [Sulfurifustis variabilis]BAU47945.1 ribonuclease HII [Sulfurifustis variabilis]
MALDLQKLAISEIRARLLKDDGPVSPQLLNALKRDARRGVRDLYTLAKRRADRAREERARLDAMLNFERVLWKSGVKYIAGVDEVGVGPLAGPVVAAAVVFAPDTSIDGVDDSKRLDPERRRELADRIRDSALGIGIGAATVEEIDRLNVYQAGLLAMRRAVEALPLPPQHVLVDARTIPGVAAPQNPFTKGDGINFSIAAASIVAKTHRDRLMEECDPQYPEYGFARHKGYSTPEHQAAIRRYGPCPLHRVSYPFIRELRGQYSPLFYELQALLARARTAKQLDAVERRFKTCSEELGEHEARKLKLVLSRRWKAL